MGIQTLIPVAGGFLTAVLLFMLGMIWRTVENNRGKIGETSERLVKVETLVSQVSGEANRHEDHLNQLEEKTRAMFSRVTSVIQSVDEKITSHEQHLQNVESQTKRLISEVSGTVGENRKSLREILNRVDGISTGLRKAAGSD